MFTCGRCGYNTLVKCNYTRHMNKKVQCVPVTNGPVENISAPLQQNIDIMYARESCDTYVDCNKCEKRLKKTNYKRHLNVCKGVPKNTCRYCLFKFSTQPAHSRHQNRCKSKPINLQEQPATPSGTSNGHIEISNITNNNTTNITNITNNNITNLVNFGSENLNMLLQNDSDPRLKSACKYILDTIDLVHFNEDYPENQNVRKLHKKSNLMEFKMNDRWEPESCKTGIPKLRLNLEGRLKTTFDDDLTDPNLREFLYNKSHRGVVPQETILIKHNYVNSVKSNEENCADECQRVAEKEVKRMKIIAPNGLCNTIFVDNLLKMVNEVRVRYEEEPLTAQKDMATYIRHHLPSKVN